MDKDEVLFHLIEIGLLEPRAVVEDDVRITSGTRRHEHFFVRRARGPGLFVKAVREGTFAAAETMQREASYYALVQAQPALAALGAAQPRLLHYDQSRSVLVVELLDGEAVSAYHSRLGIAPPHVAAMAGDTLARCQHDATALLSGSRAFAGEVPWILGLRYPDALRPLLAAYPALAASLEPSRATLAWLYETWSPQTVIHGDMKFENWLITEGGRRLRIVDWELADAGDALWDAGSIVQDYLSAILPLPHESVLSFVTRLHPTRTALRAFWAAWRDATGRSDADLHRCVAYAGARGLQVAFERAHMLGMFDQRALLVFRTGLAAVSNPSAVKGELFDV